MSTVNKPGPKLNSTRDSTNWQAIKNALQKISVSVRHWPLAKYKYFWQLYALKAKTCYGFSTNILELKIFWTPTKCLAINMIYSLIFVSNDLVPNENYNSLRTFKVVH